MSYRSYAQDQLEHLTAEFQRQVWRVEEEQAKLDKLRAEVELQRIKVAREDAGELS